MKRDFLPAAISVAALVCIALLYGSVSAEMKWFPGKQITWAIAKAKGVQQLLFDRREPISKPGGGPRIVVHAPEAMEPGLTFVVAMGEDMLHRAEVLRPDGTVVYNWPIDWFEIWPNDGFLPRNRRPRRQPGASVHGSHVLADGSVVFNFEYLSTIKLDACGNTDWKLENLGHHSVDVLENGTIWVGAQIYHPAGSDPDRPAHRAPLSEDTAQEISAEGEILQTISTLDLMQRNDLTGFLFATTKNSKFPVASGDTMHLNDVEVFPKHLPEGVFAHGDVMVSLRNINSVVVFDPETLEIKHIATGMFLRQHDPDFTSGNSYILFDNNNLAAADDPAVKRSRILEITASADGGVADWREVFRGPEAPDFFSNTKGRHQLLNNGNVLIVVSNEGRVLELAPDGRLVWEFRNALTDNYRGLITEAQRLPPEMDEAFFEALGAGCGG